MALQKIDKKQLPQVIGLGVASCGMFGYFAYKMVMPSAAAAPAPPAKAAPTPSGGGAAGGTAKAAPAATTASAPPMVAPPPSPGMHDPFVPAIIGTAASAAGPMPAAPQAAKIQEASISGPTAAVPPAPPLPPMGRGDGQPGPLTTPTGPTITPMPVAPSAPPWTVTGVLRSGGETMAILRNGDQRLIVHAGDMVDSQYRIVEVTREFVVLRHGEQSYSLPLGGSKTDDKGDQGKGQTTAPTAGAPFVGSPPAAGTPATITTPSPATPPPTVSQTQTVTTPAQAQTITNLPSDSTRSPISAGLSSDLGYGYITQGGSDQGVFGFRKTQTLRRLPFQAQTNTISLNDAPAPTPAQ